MTAQTVTYLIQTLVMLDVGLEETLSVVATLIVLLHLN